MSPRPAALYLRVSTAAQAGDERFGLAVQTRAAQLYADQHGLKLTRTYQDVITGTRATRQALDQLLDEAGQYEAVLVSSVDRLARRTGIAYAVLEELLDTGMQVHSADMGLIDPHDEMSALNFGVRSVFAQTDHMRIAKRLKGGMLAKVRSGKPVVPPTGYGWRDGENYEPEAQWIRQMFTWAQEGWSVLKISRELNRLGVTTRTGGRWADSAVKYLLKNPLHKGLYTFGKARKGRGDGRDLVTCEVPAIITAQQWDAVQRSLAQRSTGGRPNTVDLNVLPLAKRLRCGVCGSTMSAKSHHPHPSRPGSTVTYHDYHCYRTSIRDGKQTEKCTHRRHYGVKKFHPFLLEQLRALAFDDVALLAAINTEPPAPLDTGPAVAAIDKRLKNLKLLALDGGLSPAEYRETREELEAQKAALTAPAANLKLEPPDLARARRQLLEALSLPALLDTVRALDLQAVVHPDGRVDITLNGL